MRLHLDTDIGGNPDDACALTMLLGRRDVELTGITTTIDPGGRRAGYAAHLLRLADRSEIPLAAGVERPLTTDEVVEPLPYLWPEVAPAPGPLAAAQDLLCSSIDAGATVVAIGPLSTLATLARDRRDALARARVVVMGGWVGPLGVDLPDMGPEADFNVAVDPGAAEVVADSAGDLTWVPLAVTLRTALGVHHLARLRARGALGGLLADQVAAYVTRVGGKAGQLWARTGGPDDDPLLCLHDPLTCAVAMGWPGVRVRRRRLSLRRTVASARLHVDPGARSVGVADEVDGPAFTELWLEAVERAADESGR